MLKIPEIEIEIETEIEIESKLKLKLKLNLRLKTATENLFSPIFAKSLTLKPSIACNCTII